MKKLDIKELRKICEKGQGLRSNADLEPLCGFGSKICPAINEGGKFAEAEGYYPYPDEIEKGAKELVKTVVVDSEQSQANRDEIALKERFFDEDSPTCDIPIVRLDLSETGYEENPTTLDLSHRIADAQLRDSSQNGKKFRDTEIGKALDVSPTVDATEMYKYCPTALIYGYWDAAGKRGGFGTKWERTAVGTITGYDFKSNVKACGKMDKINIPNNIPIKLHPTEPDEWEIADVAEKKGNSGKSKDIKKPSEINYGGIAPTVRNYDNIDPKRPVNVGITSRRYRQTFCIQVGGLKKLKFAKINGKKVDVEARMVLCSLAMLGKVLSRNNLDLRSGCALALENDKYPTWTAKFSDASTEEYELTEEDAEKLFKEAVSLAESVGLVWNKNVETFVPNDNQKKLIVKAMKSKEDTYENRQKKSKDKGDKEEE